MSDDIRDILGLGRASGSRVTKEEILGTQKKKNALPTPSGKRLNSRPDGMSCELFKLLYNDKKDVSPVIETDIEPTYMQPKANLGMRRVREWKWASFVNPAREDGVAFHHWQRAGDEDKEYPFTKFNKKTEISKYTDAEYNKYFVSSSWSREETDRLFDMCERFDLRFIVIQGRWSYGENENETKRTTEDLKDRYYSICYKLTKIRGGDMKEVIMFDAEHETRRKLQLERLYNRTPEQVEEEQRLLQELRKIEARKHDRDHKTKELQKLISTVDIQNDSSKSLKIDKKTTHNRKIAVAVRANKVDPNNFEVTYIKFPEIKTNGVSARSQRMKIPANVSKKKVKNVKQALQSLKINLNPISTEEVCQNFNDLRNEIVLLNELKAVCNTSAFDLHTLKHQIEILNPSQSLQIEPELLEQLPSLSENEEEKRC